MNAFVEYLLELFGYAAGGPSSDRDRLMVVGFGGVMSTLTLAWLFGTYADPLSETTWGWELVFGISLLATAGILMASWQILRYGSEISAATFGLGTNLIAVMLPLAAILS